MLSPFGVFDAEVLVQAEVHLSFKNSDGAYDPPTFAKWFSGKIRLSAKRKAVERIQLEMMEAFKKNLESEFWSPGKRVNNDNN